MSEMDMKTEPEAKENKIFITADIRDSEPTLLEVFVEKGDFCGVYGDKSKLNYLEDTNDYIALSLIEKV